MSKSDDKPWVKKPDIIMEQLEDRIVFAADVANAEPVAAVTVQAQAQAEAPSGGDAPAPSGGAQAPSAAPDAAPSGTSAVIDASAGAHVNHDMDHAQADSGKIDFMTHDDGGDKAFWTESIMGGAKIFEMQGDAKTGPHDLDSASEGLTRSFEMQKTDASDSSGKMDFSAHDDGGGKAAWADSQTAGAKLGDTHDDFNAGVTPVTVDAYGATHDVHSGAEYFATDSQTHGDAKLEYFTTEHKVHDNYVVNETLDPSSERQENADASFQFTASEGQDHHADAQLKTFQFTEAGDSHTSGNVHVTNPHDMTEGLNLTDPNASTSAGIHVLVVSSAIQDADVLAQDAGHGVITVVYDANTDSPDSIISKIETALDGHKADSIAFATEGEGAGQFELTSHDVVNSSSLMGSAELQHFWKDVGSLVNDGGRIDLLACDMTSDARGDLLLSQLETLTGKDFAASSDPTGNVQYGGNWLLESDSVNVAPIYFDAAALDNYSGVLGYNPSITGLATSVAYTENAGAKVLDSAITISDSDNPNMMLATVKITGNYQSGQDTLGVVSGYTLPSGVTKTWDAGTGTLTFSGSATKANYELIFERVTYTNTSDDPSTAARTVSWQVEDTSGLFSTVKATTVSVTAVNDAPTSIGGEITTSEDTRHVFTAGDFKFSDVETSNTLQKVQITQLETAGALKLNGVDVTLNQVISVADIAAGKLTFDPASNVSGQDYATFGYKVSDGTAYSVAASAMTIDVAAVDDAPVLTAPASVTTAEDSSIAFTGANLIKVTDVEADRVSVTLTAEHGTVTAGGFSGSEITLNGSPTEVSSQLAALTFKPAPDYNGPASITVHTVETATADQLGADATIAITVTAVDDAPVVTVPTSVTTSEDTSLSFTDTNLISVTDIEADHLTVTLTATNGTVTAGSESGPSITLEGTPSEVSAQLASLSFAPTANYNGPASITVHTVETGGDHLGADGIISITVAAVDDAPVLGAIPSVEMSEDGTAKISLSEYIKDVDTDFAKLIFTVKAPDGSPVEAHVENGELVITGKLDAWGKTELSLSVSDEKTTQTEAIVVNVRPVDDAPVLGAIPSVEMSEDGTAKISLSEYIKDVDTDFAKLIFTVKAPDGSPVEAHVENGELVITGKLDAWGKTELSLSVSDEKTTQTEAIVVNVRPVDDAPVLGAIPSVEMSEDGTAKISLSEYIKDVDTDFAKLIFTVKAPDGSPVEAHVENGELVITGKLDAWGKTELSLSVSDEKTTQTEAIVVNVRPVDDAPVLGAIPSVEMSEDGTAKISLSEYIKDVDTDFAKLIFTVKAPDGSPVEAHVENGELVITGKLDAWGKTELSLSVSDEKTTQTEAIVVNVRPVDDAPVLGAIPSVEMSEDGTAKISLSEYIKDVDTDFAKLIFTVKAPDGSPVEAHVENGELVITGKLDAWGKTELSLSVSDEKTTQTEAIVVNVRPVDDAPVLGAIPSVEMSEDGTAKISLSEYIKDVDTDFAKLIFTVKAPDGSPVEAHVENGELVITGKLDAWGKTELSLSVSDEKTTQTEAIVVNVRPVDDAPVLGAIPSVEMSEDGTAKISLSEYIKDVDTDFAKLIFTVKAPDGSPVEAHVENGELVITGKLDAWGKTELSLSVSDEKTTQTEAIVVNVRPVDDAPVLGAIPSVEMSEDGTAKISLSEYIKDVDTDFAKLIFTVKAPDGSPVEAHVENGELVITGKLDAWGKTELSLSVSDEKTTQTEAIVVNVRPVDDAPVLGAIPSVEMSEDGTAKISLSEYIKDVDTDFAKLIFTVKAPDGSPVEAHVENGELVITGKLDAWGKTELSLSVSDEKTTQTEAIVVNVRPVDDAPVLGAIPSVEMSEDGTAKISLSEYIKDVDTDFAKLIFTVKAPDGSPVEAHVENGELVITGKLDAWGKTELSLSVSDEKTTQTEAIVVNVRPVDDAPVLGAIPSVEMSEDGTAKISLSEYIKDVDTDFAKLIFTVKAPDGSPVEAHVENGELVITGKLDAWGKTELSLSVSDEKTTQTEAIVVNVRPVDDAPVLGAIPSVEMSEDGTAKISLSEYIKDVDTDFAKLIFTVKAPDGSPVEAHVENGELVITGKLDAWGKTELSLSVSDEKTTQTEAIVVNVRPVDDAPVLGAIPSVEMSEDGTAKISLSEYIKDVDTDFAKLIFTVKAPDGSPVEAHVENGELVITGKLDAWGKTELSLSVSDEKTTQTEAIVVNVRPVDDAPVLGAIPSVEMSEDGTAKISLSEYIKDVDTDFAKLIFTVKAPDGSPVEAHVENGELVITGKLDAWGKTELSLSVSDEKTTQTEAIVVNVRPVDDAPVLGAIPSVEMSEDGTAKISLSEYIKDVDTDFAKLIFTVKAPDGSPVEAHVENGELVITGKLDAWGKTELSLSVSDEKTTQTEAIVVNVRPVDDAPVLGAIPSVEMSEDGTAKISLSEYIKDVDTDFAKLIFTVKAPDGSPVEAHVENGELVITGKLDAWGKTELSLSVSDEKTTQTEAIVVNVRPVDDAPVLGAIPSVEMSEDGTAKISLSEYIKDVDTDFAKLIFTVKAPDGSPVEAHVENGELVITGKLDAWGKTELSLSVSDEKTTQTEAIVVNVRPVDDAPVLGAIPSVEMSEDGTAKISLSEYIKDVDTDFAKLIFTVKAPDGSPVEAHVENGELVITGKLDAWGKTELSLSVSDEKTTQTEAIVVNVRPVDDAPVLGAIPSVEMSEDGTAKISLSEYIKDVDTDFAKLIFTVKAPDGSPVEAHVENGELVITGKLDAWGKTELSLSVSDEKTTQTEAIVVNVRPVDDAPVLGAIPSVEMSEDGTAKISLSEYIKDVDTDFAKLIFTVKAPDGSPVEAHVENGELVITGKLDAWGKTELSLSVSDEKTTQTEAIVVNVRPVDDAPVLGAIPSVEMSEDGTAKISLSEYIKDVDTDFAKLIFTVKAPDGSPVEAHVENGELVITGKLDAWGKTELSLSVSDEKTTQTEAIH